MADGFPVDATSPTMKAHVVTQNGVGLAELLPGTRVLVRYKPIGHIEIDRKLQHLVYERIILWRIDGILFVATPNFDLCIE